MPLPTPEGPEIIRGRGSRGATMGEESASKT